MELAAHRAFVARFNAWAAEREGHRREDVAAAFWQSLAATHRAAIAHPEGGASAGWATAREAADAIAERFSVTWPPAS